MRPVQTCLLLSASHGPHGTVFRLDRVPPWDKLKALVEVAFGPPGWVSDWTSAIAPRSVALFVGCMKRRWRSSDGHT
ncbi:hypothetical protein PIIN_07246 [Serendipita indica DSM 11827]|uniref:Uncharacterized protein n=1 Tax=Serendipita indica (strain DSM 11827) TaxID=1109443 RepID=G4TPN5_SERID|nr:hypothetical protein PIIN_07246 [Serendipita indica DSM 11827]